MTVYFKRGAGTAAAASVFSGVRQTVSAGPLDTNGFPTFLPATNAALSITSQNVSGTVPLVASSANGWSATTGLPVDQQGYSTTNLAWAGLTNNRAAATPNYLYAQISGGVLTTASTLLAPIYQWGGTPAVTSGQITFNISEMKAYLGNGATAPQTYLVLFGEAATDATTVISTVAYSYNGRYDSGFTATLPATGTPVSKNHNIGDYPSVDFIMECTTTDSGYAVGDRIAMGAFNSNASSTYTAPGLSTAKLAMSFVVVFSNVAPFLVANKSTGAGAGLTAANWKYKMTASRRW